MESSEIELVKRAQCGDEQAFNDLYQVYYTRAIAIAFRYTNDFADAQDVVQETFVQVHHSLPNLQEPTHFYSWLNRILHSKSVDLFYRNRNHNPVDPLKIEKVQTYEEKRRYMLPQEESDYISEQEVLRRIISEMDEKYRVVLELAYFQQMKLEEISTYLNLPIGTVKTRCRRARQELKSRIHSFEQSEQRKLHFNVDTLFPTVMTFSFAPIIQAIKQKSMTFFTGNAVNVVCAASVVALVTSGTVMAIQDAHKKQDQLPIVQNEQENNTQTANVVSDEKKQGSTEPLMNKAFGPYKYKDETITTTREAYYMCINWADSLDEMKQMSKEQIQEILPIYEGLKEANDQFYTMLQQRGWEDDFNIIKDN